MGNVERAKRIASMFEDAVYRKAAEKIYTDCSNCNRRIICSGKLIDIKKLFQAVCDPSVMPREASVPAKAMAKAYTQTCKGCDLLDTCLNLWASHNNCSEMVPTIKKRLRECYELEEPQLAEQIEGWLKEAGTSTAELMTRAARLWWTCERRGSYENLVTKCMQKDRRK
jgi:hypothetical protein